MFSFWDREKRMTNETFIRRWNVARDKQVRGVHRRGTRWKLMSVRENCGVMWLM